MSDEYCDWQENGNKYFEALLQRLLSKNFVLSVKSALEKGRRKIETEGDDATDARMRAIVAADIATLESKESDLFNRRVLDHLPSPHLITSTDLMTLSYSYFPGIDVADQSAWRASLQRFACQIEKFVLDPGWDVNDYDLVRLGKWDLEYNEKLSPLYGRCLVEPHLLWETESGFAVYLALSHISLPQPDAHGVLFARASSDAYLAIFNEIDKVLHVIVQLMWNATDRIINIDDPDLGLVEFMESLNVNSKPALEESSDSGEVLSGTVHPTGDSVSRLSQEQLHRLVVSHERQSYVGFCLDCFFECGRLKGNSKLARRVRNAILFIREGLLQTNDAIKAVLYCSALEALLLQGKGALSDTLARRIAALLVPDRLQRHDAIENVKELYDLRSRTIHGESLDQDGNGPTRLFQIIAAVLRAIGEWAEYQKKMGCDPTPDELFSELTRADRSGSAVVGVPVDQSHVLAFDRKSK